MLSQCFQGNNDQKPVAVGPWGGQHGNYWDDGFYTTIRQIIITHGAGVDSIQFEYDKQGSSIWSNKHGGSGGYKTDKVKLDFPEEYLTSIHGHYGSLHQGGPVCIRSLTFHSNESTYGPFGVEQGTYFSVPMNGGKIVGFYGRSGWFLDAIGAHLKPLHTKNTSNSIVQKDGNSDGFIANVSEKFGYSVIQGSMGKDYDLVVAIRQKDGQNPINSSPASFSTRSSSSDSSDTDRKESNKKMLTPPPVLHENANAKSGRPVTYGPWGGNGGTLFDDGVYTGIRQIYLSRNLGGIVWIRALYEQNGQAVWGIKNGGTGGFKTEKITFDYPHEVLTRISGCYGTTMLMGPTIVRSLTFHTNKCKYGPYGEEYGVAFSSHMKEGTIVGFHGRRGLFLDAIGVHVVEGKVIPPTRPSPPSLPPPCLPPPCLPAPSLQKKDEDAKTEGDNNPLWQNKAMVKKHVQFEEINHGVVKEPAPCGPGPWGGDGGKQWDDGVYTGIKQIFITRSEAICSIQMEYDRNGQSVWSVKHGGNSGNHTHRIKLDYPDEVITCISGYYGPISKDDTVKVIRSLTIYTSRGKYGPYGEEIGTFFTSSTTAGKVVGFHGRSGSYLVAIGIHMQHWLGSYKRPKSSLFKMFT